MKKSLGQNFLSDQNIARKIVAALDAQPEDRVIEIGPGAGALTRWLAQEDVAHVYAFEKDAHWAGEIKKQYPDVSVVNTDALSYAWERLNQEHAWKLVGNLPYNVASPMMWEIFSRASGVARAVFMVQKEVGQRLVAQPGTKAYGALSVWIQSHARVRMGFVVKPGVFRPPPKVDSAVLYFTNVEKKVNFFSGEALSKLLKLCFQQRRKQMQKILRGYWNDAVSDFFHEQGLLPSVRPEKLRVEQFQALSNLLKSRFVA